MNLRKELGNFTSLFYFFDDILIVNKNGIIEYAETLYPDLYGLDLKSIIGKHIYDTYIKLDGNPGSLHEVLKTGEPVFDWSGRWKASGGNEMQTITTALPIIKDREILGVLEVSRFTGKHSRKKQIDLNQPLRTKTSLIRPSTQKNKYFTQDDIITCDPVMLSIKQKIIDIADHDSTVLISGETGTGKEVAAQAIHSLGKRRNHPFISQNCAALPESLAESILFGTERGSFTNAESRKGLFELAQGGTLFLDEVSSMKPTLQAKLLKAIEEKKIRRLGSEKMIPVDIRIISALNEDPFELMNQNHLRRDLFYRLNAVTIKLPPLKDRKGDVELLADYYIDYYNELMNMEVKGLSNKAAEIFRAYEWPGNVRELKNAIESAFQTKPDRWISPDNLPDYIISAPLIQSNDRLGTLLTGVSFQQLMDDYEKRILSEACRITKTKTEAAKLLKMSKQTLNYRMGKFGLE